MSRTRSLLKAACVLTIGAGSYVLAPAPAAANECYTTECGTLNGVRVCVTKQVDCAVLPE